MLCAKICRKEKSCGKRSDCDREFGLIELKVNDLGSVEKLLLTISEKCMLSDAQPVK